MSSDKIQLAPDEQVFVNIVDNILGEQNYFQYQTEMFGSVRQ